MSSTVLRSLAALCAAASLVFVWIWAYGIAVLGLALLGLAWVLRRRARKLDSLPLAGRQRVLDRAIVVLVSLSLAISVAALALVK